MDHNRPTRLAEVQVFDPLQEYKIVGCPWLGGNPPEH
jgi:hypothetical protein